MTPNQRKLADMQAQLDALSAKIEAEPSANLRIELKRQRAKLSGEMVTFRHRCIKSGEDPGRPKVGPDVGKQNPDYVAVNG